MKIMIITFADPSTVSISISVAGKASSMSLQLFREQLRVFFLDSRKMFVTISGFNRFRSEASSLHQNYTTIECWYIYRVTPLENSAKWKIKSRGMT